LRWILKLHKYNLLSSCSYFQNDSQATLDDFPDIQPSDCEVVKLKKVILEISEIDEKRNRNRLKESKFDETARRRYSTLVQFVCLQFFVTV